MSPFAGFGEGIKERFPRVSGDEPELVGVLTLDTLFSPRGQVLWSGVIVLCPSGWVMR